MRSAARNCRMVAVPPPMRTSRPSAASRAFCSASSGLASMKWNVVPPFIVDRGPRMMGQHEHRGMKGRIVAPPALPFLVGPRTTLGPELVPSHDLSADA